MQLQERRQRHGESMPMSETDKDKLVTQSTVLERGWTRAMMRDVLGEPDKEVPNPHYRRAGAPMKLYRLARVVEAESSEDYCVAKAKADKRRASSAKGLNAARAVLEAESILKAAFRRGDWADPRPRQRNPAHQHQPHRSHASWTADQTPGYISKSEVTRRTGWARRVLHDALGEPDKIVKVSRGDGRRPQIVKLYLITRVEAAMRDHAL